MRLLAAAAACCCSLKRVAHPWPLKGGVKPRQGKPSSVTRTVTSLCQPQDLGTTPGPQASIRARPKEKHHLLHLEGPSTQKQVFNWKRIFPSAPHPENNFVP